MYRSNKRRKIKQVGASAALALGLVAGGVGIASASTASSTHVASSTKLAAPGAQPGGPDHHEPGGVVSAVANDSLTVSGPDGVAHTFSLTSSTTVEKGHVSATVADLAVGEHVMIRPQSAGSNVAADVVIETPHVAGTVVSVSGSTVVISDQDGFYRTITVNSATTYTKNNATASLADLSVGTFIVAEGSVDANHTTLDATDITVGLPSGPQGAGAGPDGGPGMGA